MVLETSTCMVVPSVFFSMKLPSVIALIRRSQSPDVARTGLMQQFRLSEIQANAILEMRLQRLTQLMREIGVDLSAVMLDYPETLAPGRRRERIPMQALAGLARLARRHLVSLAEITSVAEVLEAINDNLERMGPDITADWVAGQLDRMQGRRTA